MTRPRRPTRAELAQIRDFLASDEALISACESMGLQPPTRDEYVGVDLAPGVERKRGPKELAPPSEPEPGDSLRYESEDGQFRYRTLEWEAHHPNNKLWGIEAWTHTWKRAGFWSRRLGRVCE